MFIVASPVDATASLTQRPREALAVHASRVRFQRGDGEQGWGQPNS